MKFRISFHESMDHARVIEYESHEEAADMVANGAVDGIGPADDGDDLYVQAVGKETVVRFSCESVHRIDCHREETP